MTDRSALRLVVLRVLVLALMATLLARLWQVQVLAGPTYQERAVAERVRTVVLPAPRGQVLDDRGRPLVTNRTAVSVSADRVALARQPDGGSQVLRRLARLLGEPYARLRDAVTQCGEPGAAAPPRCWNGSPYAPVPLARDLPPRVALQVVERAEEFPGLLPGTEAVRDLPLPYGVRAPHLLGYLGPVTQDDLAADPRLDRTDVVGRAGLERAYDADLRGRSGQRRVAVDPAGRVVAVLGGTAAQPGHDLVTSIDSRLQAVVEHQLAAAVQRARHRVDRRSGRRYLADSGAAVVMDVRSGRVLALASYPDYDPRVWLGGISRGELAALGGSGALLDRVTQSQGPAASPFKVVTTAAAAAAGFRLDGGYPCTSAFRVGDRSFANYESHAYGTITVSRALQVSCDTVFYRLAYALWRGDRDGLLTRTARAFGLGRPTGIDLPGEASGRVVDAAWKRAYWQQHRRAWCAAARTARGHGFAARFVREACTDGWRWRAGDPVNTAIGQGDTLVTPLQMATAYAAVANGGTLWEPRVGRAVLDSTGRLLREVRPRAQGRLAVPGWVLAYERRALRLTTLHGTGAPPFAGFPLDRIRLATKTGTAEVAGSQPTSWFVSFDRNLVVLMTVSQGGTGSGTSGPSVRRVWEAVYGVTGSRIDRSRALLPDGRPPALSAALGAARR